MRLLIGVDGGFLFLSLIRGVFVVCGLSIMFLGCLCLYLRVFVCVVVFVLFVCCWFVCV